MVEGAPIFRTEHPLNLIIEASLLKSFLTMPIGSDFNIHIYKNKKEFL